MTEAKKPREFWIRWVPYYGNYLKGDATIEEQSVEYARTGSIIKVIEYSAMQNLIDENEKLKAENADTERHYESANMEAKNYCDDLFALKEENAKLVERLKKAEDVIKKIYEEFNGGTWPQERWTVDLCKAYLKGQADSK